MRLHKSTIYLENIRLHGYIGVLPQEQLVGNDYVVSLQLDYPVEQAVNTDLIEHTADYAFLLEAVKKHLLKRYALLEHTAGRIAQEIFIRYPQAHTLTIDIRKIDPPLDTQTDGAGVRLTFNNNI